MAEVREQLLSIEEKYKRFKQQQFTFITALERSRGHARDKTEPVSTVAQVMHWLFPFLRKYQDNIITIHHFKCYGEVSTM